MSKSFRLDFLTGGGLPECPIFDMHGHWGPVSGIHLPAAEEKTAALLLRRAKVARLVICHHASLFSPGDANRPNIEAVRRMPDVLRAYCGINPGYPDIIARDLESFESLFPEVFVGFKMLSSYHKTALTHRSYRPVWEYANERKLPVLIHTWGGCPFNGYEPVREAAGGYPRAKILLGHSLHGEWENAVRMANEHPNVYLELTAVLDERGVVENFVRDAGSEKVVFGTDFPWFSHHYYLGALLGAGLDEESMRDILYRNAMRILGENPPL